MLLCHPASVGHSLNLQKGGSIIIWFGLNWSLSYTNNLTLSSIGKDRGTSFSFTTS